MPTLHFPAYMTSSIVHTLHSKQAILVALAGAGLVVAAIGYGTANQPAGQPTIATTQTPAETGDHKGHSHSVNSTTSPKLPADFPAEIPLPSSPIISLSSSTKHWSIAYTLEGGYQSAMNSLRHLYVAAGFADENASDQIPYSFSYKSYHVQVVGFAHDHSNAVTNVTIVVSVD